METATTFVFDKDYKNLDQVAHLWDAYAARYDELEAAGQYPYNASFKGHIPGADGPDEDTAIYLLQNIRHVREDEGKLADFIASGGVEITELNHMVRGTVVEFGFYVGRRTGFRMRENVRLVPRDGRPYAALPKGARTRGFLLEGRVFFREGGAS